MMQCRSRLRLRLRNGKKRYADNGGVGTLFFDPPYAAKYTASPKLRGEHKKRVPRAVVVRIPFAQLQSPPCLRRFADYPLGLLRCARNDDATNM